MTTANLSAMQQSRFPSKIKVALSALVPAEWSSAGRVLMQMRQAQMPRADERIKSRVWLSAQFLIGCVAAALIYPHIDDQHAKDAGSLMAGVLALSALIVGFVVTLMLFTGNLADASNLTLEQVKGHVSRTKYLLVSQATTLGSALALGVVSLGWLIAVAVSARPLTLQIVFAIGGGFLCLTLLRTLLLPMQIYELHNASLQDKIEAKAQEAREKYR